MFFFSATAQSAWPIVAGGSTPKVHQCQCCLSLEVTGVPSTSRHDNESNLSAREQAGIASSCERYPLKGNINFGTDEHYRCLPAILTYRAKESSLSNV